MQKFYELHSTHYGGETFFHTRGRASPTDLPYHVPETCFIFYRSCAGLQLRDKFQETLLNVPLQNWIFLAIISGKKNFSLRAFFCNKNVAGNSEVGAQSNFNTFSLPTRRKADPPDLTCSRSRHMPVHECRWWHLLLKQAETFVSLTYYCKLSLRQSLLGLTLNVRNSKMTVCPIIVHIGQDIWIAWNLPSRIGETTSSPSSQAI